jgi:hypothetical protein
MKLKVSIIIFAVFWVFALADHSANYRSIQFYAEELLKARQGLEGSGFTSPETLKERLAGLKGFRRDQNTATPGLVGQPHYFMEAARPKGYSFHRRWKTTGSADIPDMMVNQENYSSSFNQRDPCICMFPDRSFVTVWQDERNGDLDIFAQKCSFSGSAQGFNFEAGEEDFSRDQLLPRVSAIDDTSFAVIWVDEEGFDVCGRKYYRDLSPAGSAFQIDDSPIPFTTWSPKISSGPDGTFVVVWADTRSGSNVYARRFDHSGNPLGASFKVSQGDGSKLRTSPGVSVGHSGKFVVVWEDYRNLDGDIYAQRFDSSGTGLGENILVTLDSFSEDQYSPSVSMGLNDRFIVAWVDLRYGYEHKAIFARSFSFENPLGDTALFSVTSGTSSVVQGAPPIVADTLGRFTVAWTEYTPSDPTVYAQRFDSLGQALGDTIIVSSLQCAGERHGMATSSSPDGSFTVTWMDNRSGNYDIYAQAVTSDGFLNGTNLTLNDDELGANQDQPQIAVREDGGFVVVWEDFRRGGSDIFMRRFDQSASPLSDDHMVNDSLGRFYHGNPDLACDGPGKAVVVWEDARGSLLEVYGQLFDPSGNPMGGNFRVNCQGMVSSSFPCCDMSPAGKFVVVWSASEGNGNNVYGRLFSSDGAPVDTCFVINDDGLNVEHLNPRVAMDSSGGFVVAWQDRREGQDRIYAQRFAPGGSEIDANFAIYCSRPDPPQNNSDLDVNQRGDFVVTWAEPFLSPAMIFAQRYDSAGVPVDTNIAVINDPLAHPDNPKVALTDDNHFVVAWTDHRTPGSDVYFQAFFSGLPQGPNRRVNDAESALQDLPDIDVWNSYVYSVWRDNRAPGLGFSIFFNTIDFTETAVEQNQDEERVPEGILLSQNYPNPFNPVTTIQYTVDGKQSRGAPVTLKIYNVLGQLVQTLVDEEKSAGTHRATWNGRDDRGEQLSSGVYLYRLEIGELSVTRRMLLVK